MRNSTKSKIISDPKILGGKPVIAGTRITIEFVLELLSSGWTYEQIMKDYRLKKKDIITAIDYARETVSDVQIIPFSSLKIKS